MAAFRDPDSASGKGMENMLCVSVSNHRESLSANKARSLLDIMWGTWSGMFDDEFQELSQHDMDPQGPFLWHRFLSDNSAPLGLAYRAFLSACTSGHFLRSWPSTNGISTLIRKFHASCVARVYRARLATSRSERVSGDVQTRPNARVYCHRLRRPSKQPRLD